MATDLPCYDIHQTYQWNYDHAPQPREVEVPLVPGQWTFCGLPVDSPLGIPAGPLLNGKWILYYASLGFDVLTYKTVRSGPRECYPLPNLQPVTCGQVQGTEQELPAQATMDGSWAVSFGMPSQAPDAWRRDIEWTRNHLPSGKLLSVSVVGTIQPDWTLEDLADDYAQCARWAVESGADSIETNFSCPNVSTCDGQLYQQPEAAALVAQRVRAAIGSTPYLVKIGHQTDRPAASELLDALLPHIDGLAMTNSIATTVIGPDGKLLFEGAQRGICGRATREASTAQVRLFRELCDERDASLEIIGVGGAETAEDVANYLRAGAGAVHLATAAMVDPLVAVKIRQELANHSAAVPLSNTSKPGA